MTNPLPIPDNLCVKVPPDAQAAIAAVFVAMQQRHAESEARVSDLEARLKLNSTNSSKPPSSNPIGMKRGPPAPSNGKKRGGQPGHRKAHRTLVPPEKLRQTIHCEPEACRRCGQGLRDDDPEPLILQVAESPRIEPIVDEYRLHRLTCPGCGQTTCGALPPVSRAVVSAPTLQAVLALLARPYRLSKRQIQQVCSDLFALSMTHDCIAALTTAGLDPDVGFFNVDRLGRPGLALDLVEEFRTLVADRLVLTLINRQQLGPSDFVARDGGAVELTIDGRKTLVQAYVRCKREEVTHPLLGVKARIGQFPFLQAKLPCPAPPQRRRRLSTLHPALRSKCST